MIAKEQVDAWEAEVRDLKAALSAAEARALKAEQERDALRAEEDEWSRLSAEALAWVEGLAEGATCAFCSPAVTDDKRAGMEAHVDVCPRHPAALLRAERDALRQTVGDIVNLYTDRDGNDARTVARLGVMLVAAGEESSVSLVAEMRAERDAALARASAAEGQAAAMSELVALVEGSECCDGDDAARTVKCKAALVRYHALAPDAGRALLARLQAAEEFVAEGLTHAERGYGSWTSGMRERAKAILAAYDKARGAP